MIPTTGKPHAVRLETDLVRDKRHGKDVAAVKVYVTDEAGRPVPDAGDNVTFAIEGDGRIIGVGNGDPSCHEQDVFWSEPKTWSATWRWQTCAELEARKSAVAKELDTSTWKEFGPRRPTSGVPQGGFAVFRAEVELERPDILTEPLLTIGQVDDEGWIYVNGMEVLHTDDWRKSYRVHVAKFLTRGKNVISIVVRNSDGPGGMGGGLRLVAANATPVRWSRTLFGGLAQVLVQRPKGSAGKAVLTAEADGLARAKVEIVWKN
jgi:beta-galactosidase